MDRLPRTIADRVKGLYGSSAIRFCIQSGVTLGLNVSVTVGLHELFGVAEEVAFLIALVVVMFVSFLSMRYFVYDGAHQPFLRQSVQFVASSIAFRALEYFGFLVLHTWLGLFYAVASVTVLFVSFVAKYFFYKLIIFGDSCVVSFDSRTTTRVSRRS